jgi:predicted transcriptional regulator
MEKLILAFVFLAFFGCKSVQAQQLSWEEKINPQYQIDWKKAQGEEELRRASQGLENAPTVVHAPQSDEAIAQELAWREGRRVALLAYMQDLQNGEQTPENEALLYKYTQALRQNEDKIGGLRTETDRRRSAPRR